MSPPPSPSQDPSDPYPSIPPETPQAPRTKRSDPLSFQAPALRLLDATLTEALRGPGKTLDRDDIQALCRNLPLPGIPSAGPLYPEGAYGWDLLHPAARSCIVLEPLTRDAHAHAHRHLGLLGEETGNPEPVALPLPGRAAAPLRVLVDPVSLPLRDADADPDDPGDPLPDGWVRERVVHLDPPPASTAEGPLPERIGDDRLMAKISLLVARMPRHERLRIHDPHGAVTPELAARLAGLTDSPRLTLHLEDPDGLGPATARAALAPTRGPLVRTSLLGIGPRTGLPPTEFLIRRSRTTNDPNPFEQAVKALEDHGGFGVPANHPYWGRDRHATVEIEHLVTPHATPRTNPATLEAILRHHLDEWQLTLTRQEHDRILFRLLATVRPGETLTGPVLWALVAQETDLAERATRSGR